jgi:hypothetical protein
MKKPFIPHSFFLAIAMLLSTGCASGAYPVPGGLYSDLKGPRHAVDNPTDGKTGKACATNILFLFGTGDAGINDAMKAGGLTQVTSVDYSYRNYLFFWSEYCTIVTGK